MDLDISEILKRVVKYLIEGLAVAIAAYYIPSGRRLPIQDVAMIAVSAAATFAILDMYVPSIAGATRSGVGIGMGANMAGFPSNGNIMMN